MLTTRPSAAFPPVGGVGYRFGQHVMTDVYEAWKPIGEQMGFDERIRLLHVAYARARDHLVLSSHRQTRARPRDKANSHTNAELLVKGMGDLLEALPHAANTAEARHPDIGAVIERPAPPPPLEEWQDELSAALKAGSRPTAVAATALTDEGGPDAEAEPDPGLQKRPRDLDLPPWLKGRYGSAVGRAVHSVLQTVDLATGAGVDAAVAAQCDAEAVPDRTDDVRRLVQHALASTTVQQAARHPHWREVYVCTPIGHRLLEGYIDPLPRPRRIRRRGLQDSGHHPTLRARPPRRRLPTPGRVLRNGRGRRHRRERGANHFSVSHPRRTLSGARSGFGP